MVRRGGRNRWQRRWLHWRWRLRHRARRFSYNWQLLHFAATPFGITLTTIVATHLRYPTAGPAIVNFDGMASLVSISAVYYGMIAVVAELGGRAVFWALAQWQKDREAARRERRRRSARDRALGRAEGQRGIIVDMWNGAQSDEERAYIRRIAEERGITLPQ